MRRYSVDPPAALFEALRSCHAGIKRILSSPFGTKVAGVGTVYVELADGRWLSIGADQEDLEPRFEVFPITAALSDPSTSATLESTVSMTAPVSYELLDTEDWLDPSVECEGALGANPIAQCQGKPGAAPVTASAACRYAGGVRFRSAGGVELVVATLPFPYSLYCSAIPQGATFDGALYGSRAEA